MTSSEHSKIEDIINTRITRIGSLLIQLNIEKFHNRKYAWVIGEGGSWIELVDKNAHSVGIQSKEISFEKMEKSEKRQDDEGSSPFRQKTTRSKFASGDLKVQSPKIEVLDSIPGGNEEKEPEHDEAGKKASDFEKADHMVAEKQSVVISKSHLEEDSDDGCSKTQEKVYDGKSEKFKSGELTSQGGIRGSVDKISVDKKVSGE